MGIQPADEQKERIRAEELLRCEIRAELAVRQGGAAEPRTWQSRLWAGLNSTLGIWLLSAIFLSGLGTLLKNIDNASREAAAKRESERVEDRKDKDLHDRLALEISFRFSSAMSRLHDVASRLGDTQSEASQRAIVSALRPMWRPATDDDPPLFPEFRSYSGLALIAEMRRHAAPGEQQRLKGILTTTTGLIYEATGNSMRVDRSAKTVAALLLEHMRYAGWDNGFPLTDCKIETPFC